MRLSPSQLVAFLDVPTFRREGYKADWLLSPWAALVWVIDCSIGKRRRTVTINWSVVLSDGRLLTDPAYADQLATIRHLTFMCRSGPNATIESAKGQVRLATELINILRFAIKCHPADGKRPVRFSHLLPEHFSMFMERVHGGASRVLGIEDDIRLAVTALRKADALDTLFVDGSLDISKLASTINIPPRSLGSMKCLKRVLRDNGLPYQPYVPATKHYPDYRRRDEPDQQASRTSIEAMFTAWEWLWTSADECPDRLEFNPLEYSTPSRLAKAYGRSDGRTPTIPEDIALHHLNWALRFVVDYGRDLVSYYHDAMDTVRAVADGGRSGHDYFATKAFNLNPPPASLGPLNLGRIKGRETNQPRPRTGEEISLVDAVRLLIAACFLVIGIFSSRRVEELLSLESDAVRGDVGAYVLRFFLEKGTDFGPVQQAWRPIPDVAQLAVSLLTDLCATTADKSQTIFSFDQRLGGMMSAPTLQSCLDMFGDYIESPLITHKKTSYRWYIRPHELRRFFAMMFFWANPDAYLDALSWFLGHLDREQTIRYLTEAVSGRAFAKHHADVVEAALRNGSRRIENKDRLLRKISSHFDVDDVTVIKSAALRAYLKVLSDKGVLSFTVTDCPSGTCGDSLLITYQEGRRAAA